jgi:TRAP-type C4-dicarboxylate transport system permease small subunit
MTALDKLEKFNRTVINKIEWIGLAAFLVMMFITCIDVIGAKMFLRPVNGALDIVALAQLVTISFAGAAALIHGRHVQVEFFVVLLPKRVQACVDFLIHALGLFLFIMIVWRLTKHAHYFQIGGEVSPTVRIPLSPFVYGAAFATIPICIVFLFDLIKSFFRMVKK